MEVASFCPLPVGVLPWNAPQPVTTVIVKATFSLARGGVATLARQQEPLSLDRPLADSDEELYRPTDFVPRKQGVDVLLVGHARAETPTTIIPFSLTVGERRMSWLAVSSAATVAIPLLREHVRVREPGASGRVAAAPHRASTWHHRTIVGEFDFARFNAADVEHRLGQLRPGTTLTLDGLLPGAAHRSVDLASLAPYVFIVPGSDPASLQMGRRVPLRCDTLWIDTDRSLCTLTWRGTVERTTAASARPLLAAGLCPDDDVPSWEATAAGLDDAHWYEAVSEGDLEFESPVEFTSPDGPLPDRRGGLGGLAALPLGSRLAADSDPKTAPVPRRASAPPQRGGPTRGDGADTRARPEPTQVLPNPRGFPAPPTAEAFAGEEPFGNSTSTLWPRREVIEAVRAEEERQRLAADDEDERTAELGERLPPHIAAAIDEETDGGDQITATAEIDPEALRAGQRSWQQPPSPPRPPATPPDPPQWPVDDETTGELPLADDDHHDRKLTTGVTVVLEPPPSNEARRSPTAGPIETGAEAADGEDPTTLSRSQSPVTTDDDAETAPQTSRTPEPLAGPVGAEDRTRFSSSGGAGAGRALPFVAPTSPSSPPPAAAPASERPPRSERDEQTAIGVELDPALLEPLPFRRSASTAQPTAPAANERSTSRAASPSGPSAQDRPGTARSFQESTKTGEVALGGPALPFERAAEARRAADPASQRPLPPPQPPRPRSAGELRPSTTEPEGPAADQPTRATAPELPLETYARIKAELWNRPGAADEILTEHDLDQTAWRAIEIRQSMAIARDASSGSGQLAIRIRRAIAAARSKLTGPAEEGDKLDLEEYAALRVAVADAEDPQALLDERGLTAAAWEQLQRTWAHRAKSDGRLAARLRRAMAAARRRARDDEDG